jgi:hypothetical protein
VAPGTVRACLVAPDDVGGRGDRERDQVRAVRRLTHRGQGQGDPEGAVGDVVRPRRAGPDCPVDALLRAVGGREVRRDGIDGEVEVAGVERPQRDPRVARQELDHLVPALSVEERPDPLQRANSGFVAAGRAQGDGDPREAEVQRTVVQLVDARGQRVSAASSGARVPVVPEVPLRLDESEHDTGSTVVQRRVVGLQPLVLGQPVGRAPGGLLRTGAARLLIRDPHVR